ncbi:MAG: hypothetical protein ACE5JX_15945 [Acidobacteriota bacterium]
MLVIISDLHLTDGTSGETIPQHAFRIFRQRLGDAAYEASWRLDAKYRPIEALHLVLLGDILDLIRSTKWLEQGVKVRPWDNPQSAPFVEMIKKISGSILKRNADALSVIQSLSEAKVTLPPATPAGKPAKVGHEDDAPNRVPVKVHVHYMVGNHDWFYHLPGTGYDGIRKAVITAMGLANDPTVPFPHKPEESNAIRQVYEEHRVFARHGDIFDPFNFEQDRNQSSLGDAIVIELLNRFPRKVRKEMANKLSDDCVKGLREIDNVRPLLAVPVWVNGLLRRTCPDRGLTKKVKQVWDDLVDDFLDLPFIQKRDSVFNPFDSVDRLEWALKFSQGVSLGNLSRLFSWISQRVVTPGSPFYRNAFKESAFTSRRARFIVYGHTHHQEIIPLDSVALSSGILNQIYINSGTWRRVHVMARLHPDEQEFVGYNVMTYVAFFKDGERGGRPFDFWSGALGVKT